MFIQGRRGDPVNRAPRTCASLDAACAPCYTLGSLTTLRPLAGPTCVPPLLPKRLAITHLVVFGLCLTWTTAFVHGGQARLCVGYSSRSFMDVNTEDARAAARVLVETIARNEGFETQADVVIFDTVEEMAVDLVDSRVHVMTLSTPDFLELEDTALLEPVFLPLIDGKAHENALLLVRKDAGITDLAQLRGGRLRISRSARHDIPLKWLDAELAAADLGPSVDFFSRIDDTRSGSPAITSVFFGQADACLVLGSSYGTAVDLNPQLGRQLKALGTSPAVVGSVVCLSTSLDDDTRQQLLSSLARLHLDPQGRQLLAIFHVDRLLPFEALHLARTREVFAAYGLPRP